MKPIATGRIAQAAVKVGEHAPVLTGCCNACRTCVTTNAIGVLGVAAATSLVGLRRVLARLPRRG